MVPKTDVKETIETVEKIKQTKGGFVIVAGINGHFRKYLLDDVISEFSGKKQVEKVNFSIETEIGNHFNLFAQFRSDNMHFKKTVEKINNLIENGVNVIGAESDLDKLVEYEERGEISSENRHSDMAHWLKHRNRSRFPQYNLKIILADVTDKKKHNYLMKFIKDYKKVHENLRMKFNHKIINVQNKSIYTQEYQNLFEKISKAVKAELNHPVDYKNIEKRIYEEIGVNAGYTPEYKRVRDEVYRAMNKIFK